MVLFTIYNDTKQLNIVSDINLHNILKICSSDNNQIFILNTQYDLFVGNIDINNNNVKFYLLRSGIIDIECYNNNLYIVDQIGCVYKSITINNFDNHVEWLEIIVHNPKACIHGTKNLKDKIPIFQINCNNDGLLLTSQAKELYAMGDFGDVIQSDVPIRVECFNGFKILDIATGDNFVVVLTYKYQNTDDDNISDISNISDLYINAECPKCAPGVSFCQLQPDISKSTTETSIASSVSPDTFEDEDNAKLISDDNKKNSATLLRTHKDTAINFLLESLSISSEDCLLEAGKQTKLLKENVSNITTMVYEGVKTLSRHMSGSDNNDPTVDDFIILNDMNENSHCSVDMSDTAVSLSDTSSLGQESFIDDRSLDTSINNKLKKLNRIGGTLLSTGVWCFGSVNRGQLGTGDHIKRTRINPVLGLSGQGVTKVSCGREHSIALTIDGRLFLWGNNSNHQITLENIDDFSIPKRYRNTENVFDAICGINSTYILHNNNTINILDKLNVNNDIEIINNNFNNKKIYNNNHILLSSNNYLLINYYNYSNIIEKYLTQEQKFVQEILNLYITIIKQLIKKLSYISYNQLYDNLCTIYLNIINITIVNIKTINEYYKNNINCTDIIFLLNTNEYINLYYNYIKIYCNVICIDGFRTLTLIIDKKNYDSINIFNKIINHIEYYIHFLNDLIEIEKLKNNNDTIIVYLNEKLQLWEKLSNDKQFLIEQSQKTINFWLNNNKVLLKKLQIPERRLIINSNNISLKLLTSGRFTTNYFLLFSDQLCYLTNLLNIYPLKTLWISSISDRDVRKNALKIITPEDNLIVIAQSHNDKMLWLDNIEKYIKVSLGTKNLLNKVPQNRNASYTFSDKHVRYPGVKYFGRWYIGNMHGIGHLEFTDGKVYNGQMSNNDINGFGRMFTPSVGLYEGDFENGKYHGYGVLEMKTRGVYEGNFRDGMYHGHGILRTDRYTYIGEFMSNNKNGYGVLDDNLTGDKYMGMFVDNKKHGSGICITMDGNYFEGMFVNDILTGDGVAIFVNNSYYEGDLTITGPNGRGSFYIPNNNFIPSNISYNKYEIFNFDDDINDKTINNYNGNIIIGILNGTWSNMKIINGTITMNQLFTKIPKTLGLLAIDNNKKWLSLFSDWEISIFGTAIDKNLSTIDNKLIWNKIAVFITNSKRKEKLKSDDFMQKNNINSNNNNNNNNYNNISDTLIIGKNYNNCNKIKKWNSINSINSSQYSKRSTLDIQDKLDEIFGNTINKDKNNIINNEILLDNLKIDKTTIITSTMNTATTTLTTSTSLLTTNCNQTTPTTTTTMVTVTRPPSSHDKLQKTLDFIPSFAINHLEKNDLILMKEYLKNAFNDINHPLGVLNNKITNCFYTSYGCWKFKPISILSTHAMNEWESISLRIYQIICYMFPALNSCNLNDGIDGETISHRSLLYPILLSEGIYSSLFVLYASKCSNKDELYHQRVRLCNKKADHELFNLLNIDMKLINLIKNNYFNDAIECFRQFKEKYCPNEMIKQIELTFKLIEEAKNDTLGTTFNLNADYIMPLTIFLILRADIQHFGAEISLLEDLMGTDYEQIMQGYAGYCFTTIKASYQHILSDKFFQE